MKTLLKLISAALLCAALATPAWGGPSADAVAKATENWQPVAVEESGGVVTVVLPQRQVTETIYKAVVKSGICFFANAKVISLPGDLKEVVVLNQFRKQGWVFEEPSAGCQALAQAGRQTRDVALLGRSRVY